MFAVMPWTGTGATATTVISQARMQLQQLQAYKGNGTHSLPASSKPHLTSTSPCCSEHLRCRQRPAVPQQLRLSAAA